MHKLLIAAICLALPLAVSAAIKPGQWQITTQMPLPVMPQIPAEQLEQMRQMGISLPAAGKGGNVTVQGCVSPQDAAGDYPPLDENVQRNCKVQDVRHNGPRTTLKVVCDGDVTGSGDVEIVSISPERYTSRFHVVGTAHGLPVDMSSSAEGRWISATCK
jgi:hypothetical protein